MIRPQIPGIAFCAALAPMAVLAQDAGLPDTLTLDPIVISGGLTPLAAENYARSYTVLTAGDMAAAGVTSVQDALRRVPGVAVTSTGDSYTQVRIRGSEFSHVLVLIDGVEANSPSGGSYLFTGMDLAEIDRIEVLRGPQSTIYGSNAAAGVISITTTQAGKPGLSYGGAAEVGGLGTRAASTYIRQRGERGALSFSLSARNIDGDDNSRSGGDKDFNDITTAALGGSYELTNEVTTGFTLRRSWQEYGYDTTSSPVEDPRDYQLDAPLTAKRDETYGALWLEAAALDGRLHNRLALSGMNQTLDHFNAGAATSDDRSTRRSLRYTGSFALDGRDASSADQKLIVAAETERETYRSSYNPGGTYERDTHALALEYQGRFADGVSVQAGVRREFNDVFRDATSWNLAAAWQVPGQDLRLRAAAGRAHVNPTMFQQYGYVPGAYEGNPDLKPARSLNYELGADLGFASGRGLASFAVFQSKIDDMITGTADSAVNAPGTSTRKGFELGVSVQATNSLSLGADYTYVDASQANGLPIVRAPRHQLGLRASQEFAEGRGQASVDIRYVSGTYDMEWFGWDYTTPSPANSKLPGFTTVNLAAHYDLNDEIRLHGRIVNLFDKEYSEAWGYYGQGRTAYVGVEAKW